MSTQTLIAIWEIVGHVSTALVVLAVVTTVFFVVRGFVPVLIRLGFSLWKRKIALFASGNALTSIKGLLADTNLFSEDNILSIANVGDAGIAERASIFVVYWPDWSAHIDRLLELKRDPTALIIYAPQEHGYVDKAVITRLEQHRNVVLCNFRGRLLNDILVCMITTGYEKK